ncbi:MAG: hypothetical protein EZS28_040258, partial [Streblomastix strix]
ETQLHLSHRFYDVAQSILNISQTLETIQQKVQNMIINIEDQKLLNEINIGGQIQDLDINSTEFSELIPEQIEKLNKCAIMLKCANSGNDDIGNIEKEDQDLINELEVLSNVPQGSFQSISSSAQNDYLKALEKSDDLMRELDELTKGTIGVQQSFSSSLSTKGQLKSQAQKKKGNK